MGGKGGQTVGYHYLFSILFGIGRGPIDELRQIKVGDKLAWDSHVCTNAPQAINKPELFGGEEGEGGIQGAFRLQQGEPDQVLPGAETVVVSPAFGPFRGGGPVPVTTLPDIKAQITGESGGLMGELRGRVTLWFDGLVSSLNPYIKEWKFRVRRTKSGWFNNAVWYPDKATIYLNEGRVFAMNPAHIIYECCTNPAWARGIPVNLIDDDSFTAAANTLCAEGFGLCLVWYRQEDIDRFIQTVIDHVAATLYTDRETGKIKIKLIRDDYDVADLPLFTPSSGLIEIEEDDTASSENAVNEVIVVGHDPLTDQPIRGRSFNLAAFRANGAPVTLDQTYKGLPTTELCDRVAARDMRANAAGLRKFRVVLDRRGFRIHPGAVFRVSAPERGIGEIVLRAGEIEDGEITNGRITVRAVQDVFGVPLTTFVAPSQNIWTPPSDVAVPAEFEELIEATYRDTYQRVGAGDANAVLESQSFVVTLVSPPTVRSRSYRIESRAQGEPDTQSSSTQFFTGSANLTADLTNSATVFLVDDQVGFESDDPAGQALYVNGEYMLVDAYDSVTGQFTVKRGAVDTWPLAHAAGSRVWLIDDDAGTDGRDYAEGETVEAFILTRTFSDALSIDDATELEAVMQGRVFRPYPPAAVTVDGDSILTLSGEHPEPVIVWVERNRLTQADVLYGFLEATVAAEPGTTYRIRVYDVATGGTALGTHDSISSPWTYDTATQVADGTDALGVVWVELVAVRDGVESLVPYRFRIALRAGWGYGWGLNWGGAG